MGEMEIHRGKTPLIVSFPHTGTEIPADLAGGLVSRELALKDADWWLERLYAFVSEFDATTVRTPFSRTVIDVNRDPEGHSLYPGQATTGLVPTETFDGEPLYQPSQAPSSADIAARKTAYFEPFHAALSGEIRRLRASHDHVVLYDCHSIRTVVPRLFPGTLPIYNIGTNGGASCAGAIERAATLACAATGRSLVVNGRFRGGWITRHYGRPEQGVHAIQMELAQSFYMEEDAPLRFPAERSEQAIRELRTVIAAIASARLG